MDDLHKLLALERALERLDVEVRREPLDEDLHVSGGLCLIRGQRVVIISDAASAPERIAVLVDALRRLPTDDLWLPPAIRALVDVTRE